MINPDFSNNIGNGQTNYNWPSVNDSATPQAVLRIVDYTYNDTTFNDSGVFHIVGWFNITYPGNATGQSLPVASVQNITWDHTGASIVNAWLRYSIDGKNGTWMNISNNSIVPNNGLYCWTVPNNITYNSTVFIRIEYPNDTSVNNTSDYGFKIRGNFFINSPSQGDRWVAFDNKTVLWDTSGTIGNVSLYYSRDNFTTEKKPLANSSLNLSNIGLYVWSIPNPVIELGLINSSFLPVTVKLRVQDAKDSAVFTDSANFTLDYYNVFWHVRDWLSNQPIQAGLSVNGSLGWTDSGLASPVFHKYPRGVWTASWTHKDYGDAAGTVYAFNDTNVTVLLESKIVHVWEARTEYIYEPANNTSVNDRMAFKSYLLRDGSIAGQKDPINQTFYTIAENCSVEVYYPNGTMIQTFNTSSVSEAGFFSLTWEPTNLTNFTIAYPAITQIETTTGGRFRTPFLINVVSTVSLYNATRIITERIDVPLSVIQANLTRELQNQTLIIENKTNETVRIINETAASMQNSINLTLSAFEETTSTALEALQTGANMTLNASQQATLSAQKLEATALRFSWAASLSPNPVLTGDNVTLSVQGPAEVGGLGLLPLMDIYSWDNKPLVSGAIPNSIVVTGTGVSKAAVYKYNFVADNQFTAGKSYTYIVGETVTGGLVTGSGMVESMSLTTIAGLSAAAPEAERAAKKALEAIKAVEAVLVSEDNINIALTLKNLKDSVDTLPEALAREGPSSRVAEAVNEIADRLKALGIEEGYDFTELLEKAIGESPTIRDVRSKTDAINTVVQLLLQIFEAKFGGIDTPIVSTTLAPGSVRFRVVALNPSKTKRQALQVKSYLPEEVKPKDIIDLGALELEYDAERSIYYIYKSDVELAPSEIRVFEVEVNDVWMVPTNGLDDLKKRTDFILVRLENTEYYAKGKEIADGIYTRLKDIVTSQTDETVSRAQHIGIYRQNLLTVAGIKEDIAKMEKILATAGGPLAPEMLAKTKVKAESPTKTLTWIVIFTIIIFVGLLSGVLFFTWHRQTRLTREELLAAKKSAFPGSSQDQESKEKENQ